MNFIESLKKGGIDPTGKIDFETYWPHMFFDRTEAMKAMKATEAQ